MSQKRRMKTNLMKVTEESLIIQNKMIRLDEMMLRKINHKIQVQTWKKEIIKGIIRM